MGPTGDQFGMPRVRELVAEGGTAEEVSDRVVAAVRKHFAGVPPDDDICLVVFERVPVVANSETVSETRGTRTLTL
jgi:serine phosphatase RsbU (regulator of sigma subunit)